MSKLKRTAQIIIYTLVSALLASAQQAQRPQVSTVNITPEAGRVRVAPVGEVSDLKLEVVNEAGDTIYEAAQGAREQIDWNMKDSAGGRVAPGVYTVTVSYTTQSGKQRKRIEQVLLTDERTVSGSAAETAAATSNAPNPQPLVDGGGTTNRVPKFTDADTLTSSVITDLAGRVGIGTTAPAAGLRLDISGNTRMTPSGGNGGYMQFHTPNGETGFSWVKGTASRADIRFNGTTLTIATGTGVNVPPNTYGMVIKTTGNVGIGTASPSYKLHVDGGVGVAVYGRGDTYGVWGVSNKFGVYGKGGTYGVYAHADTYGVYAYGGAYGVYGSSNSNYGLYGQGGPTGVYGIGSTYGVNGEGDTGVYGEGTQTGVYGDAKNGAGAFGESHSGAGWGVYGRNKAGGFAGFFDGKVQVAGQLTATGNVCANNIPCSSDARLKQNVTNLKYGLDQLLRLRPVSWRWKSEPEGKPQMGLVAQEVEKVLPELVLKDTDATKPLGLNYMALLPVAVKAIQEQQRLIERLQARVSQLERSVKKRRQTRGRR